MDSVDFELVRPVEHDGKTYASFQIRRPKVKDLIQAERQPGETGREAALLGLCAGVPFVVIGEMDAGDYHAACARSGIGFLAPSGREDLSGEAFSSSTPGPAGDSTTS